MNHEGKEGRPLMNDANNAVALAPSRHHLTIPDQKTAAETVKRSGGTDGQEKLLKDLSRSPLARSECGYPRHMDHVHLARFEHTDLCQWWGRCADGYHRPIGRIMQIVEAKQ